MKPIYSFLSLLIIFYSCSKDNNSSNPSGSGSLPKTYTEDLRDPSSGRTVVTYNLSYDANGRLVSLTSIPSPPALQINYKYPDASTVTMDLFNSGSLSIHEIIWLNANSFVDSTFQYNDTNDTTTQKYLYNGSHQPIQIREYNYHSSGVTPYSTTNYTYDNNGNTLTESDDLGNSSVYDYYTNLVNSLSIGEKFLYMNKNLVKTQTYSSGGTAYVISHYYTFDNSNRLTQDSSYITVLNAIAIKSYTY